jgi:hypothetical protein
MYIVAEKFLILALNHNHSLYKSLTMDCNRTYNLSEDIYFSVKSLVSINFFLENVSKGVNQKSKTLAVEN